MDNLKENLKENQVDNLKENQEDKRQSKRKSRRQSGGSLAPKRVMDFVNKEGYTNYTMNDIKTLLIFITQLVVVENQENQENQEELIKEVVEVIGVIHYTQGPVNAPSNPDTFQMFAPMSDYISNTELLKDGLK